MPKPTSKPKSSSYVCQQCGQRFSGENALQRYAAHHKTQAHKEAGRLRAVLARFRVLLAGASLTGALPTGTESETDRDGILSSRREVHAAAFGAAAGWWLAYDQTTAAPVIGGLIALSFGAEVAGRAKRIPRYIRQEVSREVHYFVGGISLGFCIATYVL